jgi:hypothetical protein
VKPVVLHVGAMKTGSSALQRAFTVHPILSSETWLHEPEHVHGFAAFLDAPLHVIAYVAPQVGWLNSRFWKRSSGVGDGIGQFTAGQPSCCVLTGSCSSTSRRPPAPRCGVAAGIAIGVTVSLARSGLPVASSMARVFPAIFTTITVATSLAQGAQVPTGAVEPMMPGTLSVPGFLWVRRQPGYPASVHGR